MLKRMVAMTMGMSLLMSCSARKLAYGWADTYFLKQIDDYFDLSNEQKKWLKPKLQTTMAWHAASELPFYVSTLEELKARIKDGLTRADVEWAFGKTQNFGARLTDKLIPEATDFLSTISPQQIENLLEENNTRNAKREKKLNVSDDRYAADRTEDAINLIKPWVGNLTDTQRERIREFALNSRATDLRKFDNAKQRQAAFVSLLKSHPSKGQISSYLYAWAAAGTSKEPQPQKFSQRWVSLLTDLGQSLSETQKLHLLNEISTLQQDMRILSDSPKG